MFDQQHEPVAVVRQALPASLTQLAEQINAEHEATEATARASIQHARAAGELLGQVKAQVGHGNWLPWLREHCQFSERTARRYMQISDQWADLANRTRVADLSLREGLRILAGPPELDEVYLAGLPYEARRGLETNLITAVAARSLERLNIYSRVATRRPFARWETADEAGCGSGESWPDHLAKLILWRPRRARSDQDIAYEVDSALFDLWVVERTYAGLPVEEATKLADQNLVDSQLDERGLCSPDYWWADLWRDMAPDFSRLTAEDRTMIEEATNRYLRAA